MNDNERWQVALQRLGVRVGVGATRACHCVPPHWQDPDWVAVSVLIKRTEVQRVMDRLEAIGGRDMLVWDLRNTRGFE